MRVTDSASIASRIEQAFQTASTSTGTSFDYLVKTAARESSMNPAAKANTSSATGLFQFVEATWLETVKEAGPEHGLGKFSDQIEKTSKGRFVVNDPEVRQQILDLRKNPEVSSLMAGALTQKNSAYLNRRLGREPNESELYMAHFLGARGASKLIDAAEKTGDLRADHLFPSQAKANKAIFYEAGGNPRTTSEVYAVLAKQHDVAVRSTMVTETVKPVGKPLNLIAGLETEKPIDQLGELGAFDVAVAAAEARSDGFAGTDTPGPFDQNKASRRVLNAFQATETSDPFSMLFRDDGTSRENLLAANLATAFAAPEKTEFFASSEGSEAKLAVQEIGGQQHKEGPLDLRRFLSFDLNKDQKDILPPA
ncbi:MAG: lytic transglycosylase domain-containing protein [Rhodobacteraceae bacterium]|nr:lytic transglycosylase domain-containing protein [Paracoccaceae bacterium]